MDRSASAAGDGARMKITLAAFTGAVKALQT
jgi:hypothetical protein